MRNQAGLLVLCTFILVLLFMALRQQEPKVGSYDGPQSSWIDRLFGDDGLSDFGSGEGGGGYYFSSFFDGVEFRFRLKNYRAMRDDNLDEAD